MSLKELIEHKNFSWVSSMWCSWSCVLFFVWLSPSLHSCINSYIAGINEIIMLCDLHQTVSALQHSHHHLQCTMVTTTNLHLIITGQLHFISATSFCQSRTMLIIPCSQTVVGARRFSSAAPTVWNNLLTDVRSAETIRTFHTKLKPHLYTATASWMC